LFCSPALLLNPQAAGPRLFQAGHFMNRFVFVFAAFLLVPWIGGCSQGSPDIVPIAGTVTHNGQPVPNVRIIFEPTQGRISWAISDDKGRFKLDYDPDYDGAKVGTHRVYVVDESANIDPTAALSGVKRHKRAPEIAAAIDKFSQDKSTLKVEVTKADRNFQLKLD
jgi:hypothetical protein